MSVGILLQIMSHGDSVVVTKIDSLSKSFDALQGKLVVAQWMPIITAMLAGGFVLFSQWRERISKRHQELINQIRDIASKCDYFLLVITGLCKSLAAKKNYVQYWFAFHEAETRAPYGDADLIKTYYNNALSFANQAEKNNEEIRNAFADYFSCASKFQTLSKEQLSLPSLSAYWKNLSFNDAEIISASFLPDEMLKIFHANIDTLTNEYLQLLKPLDDLTDKITSYTQALN